MRFVGGTLIDPLTDDLLFGFTQFEVGFRWWHHFGCVGGYQTLDDFGFGRLARHNGVGARVFFQRRIGTLGHVQPKTRFALVLIRSVAGKTIVRKYWTNMEIVADLIS